MTQATTTPAATPADGSTIKAVLKAVEFLGGLAVSLLPGGGALTIIGLSIPEIVSIIEGIANEVPDVLALIAQYKNTAAGGTPPTLAQLQALAAAAKAANDDLAAADAEVIAGTGAG